MDAILRPFVEDVKKLVRILALMQQCFILAHNYRRMVMISLLMGSLKIFLEPFVLCQLTILAVKHWVDSRRAAQLIDTVGSAWLLMSWQHLRLVFISETCRIS